MRPYCRIPIAQISVSEHSVSTRTPGKFVSKQVFWLMPAPVLRLLTGFWPAMAMWRTSGIYSGGTAWDFHPSSLSANFAERFSKLFFLK